MIAIRRFCVKDDIHTKRYGKTGSACLAVFMKRFHGKGKARIALDATIESEGAVAARFRGTFIALR
jgi:hypothetical protein